MSNHKIEERKPLSLEELKQLVLNWNETTIPKTRTPRLDQLRQFMAKYIPSIADLKEIRSWVTYRREDETYEFYRLRKTFQYQLNKYLD